MYKCPILFCRKHCPLVTKILHFRSFVCLHRSCLKANILPTMSTNPQAFISTYAPRLRAYINSLLTPVIPPTTVQNAPLSRTTKRGTIAINYAENEYDDEDFDDSEAPRRPTGLRSRREDPHLGKEGTAEKHGKELTRPVEVQGIWREWMGKPKMVK